MRGDKSKNHNYLILSPPKHPMSASQGKSTFEKVRLKPKQIFIKPGPSQIDKVVIITLRSVTKVAIRLLEKCKATDNPKSTPAI